MSLADDPGLWSDLSPFRQLRPDVDGSWGMAAAEFLGEDLEAEACDTLPLLTLREAAARARRKQDATHKLALRRREIEQHMVPDNENSLGHEAWLDFLDEVATHREGRRRLVAVKRQYAPTVWGAAWDTLRGYITPRQGAYRARMRLWEFRAVLKEIRNKLVHPAS